MVFKYFGFEHTWWRFYQKRAVRTKFQYLRFYYYHWVDTSTGGLLAPEGVNRPVISIVTLFIRYIYNWNLQFINNEILIKLKIYFLRHMWPEPNLATQLRPFGFLAPKIFYIIWPSYCFVYDGYSRNTSCALTLINVSSLIHYQWQQYKYSIICIIKRYLSRQFQ